MTLRILSDLSDRIVAVPQSWDELTVSQLAGAYAILMSDASPVLEPSEVMWAKRLELFMFLSNTNEEELKAWRASCIEEHGLEDGHYVFLEEVDTVLGHFTHLLEEVPPPADAAPDAAAIRAYQIKLGRTKAPYLMLRDSEVGYEWHAPADKLRNLTIYELGQVFTLLESYLETQQPDLVDELIATLYRPAKPATQSNIDSDYNGDIRLPLSGHETTVRYRLPHVRRMPELAKQLILFWVASCRQAIIDDYPNIFTAPEDQPEGERVGNDYRWGGVIMSLANDVTQIDQVANSRWENTFVYLSFLEDRRKEEEMRRRLTQQKAIV